MLFSLLQLIYIFRSLGLAIPPRIRFLQRLEQKQQLTNQHIEDNKQIISHNEINCNINEQINIEYYNHNDKEKEQKNISQTINLNDFTLGIKMIIDICRIIYFFYIYIYVFLFFIDDSDNDDILTVKRKNINLDDIPVAINDKEDEASNKKKAVTKAAVAKKILRKKILPNKKIIFNEEGKVRFSLVLKSRYNNHIYKIIISYFVGITKSF